jgi:hypothetical protein
MKVFIAVVGGGGKTIVEKSMFWVGWEDMIA